MKNYTEYLDGLNDKQREAVLHGEGPLLILAGAGSGKTSTMTRRIAYLIKEKGVAPYSILAVTFTNKAAGEMRERIENLMGEQLRSWILTFHSTCLRLLRRYGELLGYTSSFGIYDPADQNSLMKKILKEKDIDEKNFPAKGVLSLISKAKEAMIEAKDYTKKYGSGYREDMVARLYEDYEAAMKKNNSMDFDDLLLNGVKLLKKNPSVLAEYQNRFTHIMVDEYQDTNKLQYELVKMLAAPQNNLCVVGDDDQCIYQWRGASIENILSFEQDFPNTKVIKLEQNYRSTANIINAAHSIIKNNSRRKAKKLWTGAERGNKLVYRRSDTEAEEADFIAREIQFLQEKFSGYGNFAVLYRLNSLSRNFENALGRRGIPYRVVGGLRYYDRKEIKDLMSYLKLVANPQDDLALTRVINEPKRGLGKATLDKLENFASYREQSLFEVICNKEIRQGFSNKVMGAIENFAETIAKYNKEKENLRIIDIYDGILRDTGYMKTLEEKDTVENRSRLDNILDFRSVILESEEEQETSLEDFLENMALLSDIDNTDIDSDAVTLMTFHSAKGLEFPVIFMTAMEDGVFPGFAATERPDGLEEERRLCYVGMTRAKKRLFLTGTKMRMLYGKTNYTRESQFLREINPKFIEGDAIYRKNNEITVGESGNIDGYSKSAPYKPFDPMAEAKRTVKGHKGIGIDLKIGDRVNHKKFGEGIVLESNGKIGKIAFDSVGIKKLDLGIAPMEKL